MTDDISFCQKSCGRTSCKRNMKNISDHSIPHSYFVEIPPDCPYRKKQDDFYHVRGKEKMGEWIYKHNNLWYCSRCGEIIYSETDDDLEIHHAYCSRCGAKMKQEGR